jgi:heme oxygenase
MNIIDIKTYPKGLKDILESNKEIILKKIENKRKLDDLENAERYNRDFHNPGKAQEERINNINNFTSSKEYKDIVNKYNSVSEEIDNFFKTENLDILLIHFTRLMGYEKKDILENGMEMLSDNLICNKVSKLF